MRYERNGRSIKAYFPRGRNEINTETNAVEAHLAYDLLIEAKKTNQLLEELVNQYKIPVENILEPKPSKKKTSDKTRKNEKEKK